MKGKIAFVLGAAVGYVLGTRAGRERYEQIKRGAQQVWHTDQVQRGVAVLKDSVGDRADDVKRFVARVGSELLGNVAKKDQSSAAAARPTANPSGTRAASTAGKSSTTKTAQSKSSTAKRTSGAAKPKASS